MLLSQVRAFSSWPGSKATFVIKEPDGALSDPFDLKVVSAAEWEGAEAGLSLPEEPASTWRTSNKKIFIRCGAGSVLQLLTVQPASKKPMQVPAYLNGLNPSAQLLLMQ